MPNIPELVRVSLGSAVALGLATAKIDVPPTTGYLMTHRNGKCTANCLFCPQARKSRGRADLLSRISWPVFRTLHVVERIRQRYGDNHIRRVCIQSLNYPDVFAHVTSIVKAIHRQSHVPISVSCQPLNSENLRLLADAGAERVGIPLDAATEDLFDAVKGVGAGGPYAWKKQFRLLEEAARVFGKDKVSTHLIVGLGETDKQMVDIFQRLVDAGVLPALFAFTPISGTVLETKAQPPIQRYRKLQLARHLIVNSEIRAEDMRFDGEEHLVSFGIDKHELTQMVRSGTPFLTSGCSGCNRPYYNEKPSGPIYNYPRQLTESDIDAIIEQLRI